MNSSRQLLLGTGVFLGGGILLFAMVKQMDAPHDSGVEDTAKVAEANKTATTETPLTADLDTEERILAQKREEREKRMAELDRRTREFLSEQERAESLAMNKARVENEQYRNNSVVEPVIDTSPENNNSTPATVTVTKPVVTERRNEIQAATNKNTQASTTTSSKKHKVVRGDGLIKLSRQYNMPVEAIAQANKISKNTTLRVGQVVTIPASNQVDKLVKDYKVKNNTSKTNTQATNKTTTNKTNSAPTSQIRYKVKSGDGLIKLSRQYNVPVEALAEANNLKTNSNLRVGQTITIPSRQQVARLQREAAARNASDQNKRDAQQRLVEARRKAASEDVKGTFGVQVALAENQKKADEIANKMRAAGYPATTSATSRGVRVIVGPEKGKEAALALKDKINADSRTGVNNAWVLYWR